MPDGILGLKTSRVVCFQMLGQRVHQAAQNGDLDIIEVRADGWFLARSLFGKRHAQCREVGCTASWGCAACCSDSTPKAATSTYKIGTGHSPREPTLPDLVQVLAALLASASRFRRKITLGCVQGYLSRGEGDATPPLSFRSFRLSRVAGPVPPPCAPRSPMCGIASFGETPLIYAARFGHTDAVARLIWLRADLTAQHTYSG